MSRTLIRIGVGGALLVLGLAALAGFGLPRIVDAEPARAVIRGAWRARTETPVEWQRTGLRWQPLTVILEEARLPLVLQDVGRLDLEVPALELRVSPASIRAGRFVLDAIVLDPQRVDFEAVLDRAGDGNGEIRIRGFFEAEQVRIDLGSELEPQRLSATGKLFGSLRSTAHAGLPPEVIGDLIVSAQRASRATRAESSAAPVDFELALDRAESGRLKARGELAADGIARVELLLEAFDVAFAGRARAGDGDGDGDDEAMAGLASGQGHSVGPLFRPDRLDLDVEVTQGRLRLPDYAVDGSFQARVEIVSPVDSIRSGRVELDLTRAAVQYKEGFRKETGTPARVVTEFAPDASGETQFDSRIEIRRLDGMILPRGF